MGDFIREGGLIEKEGGGGLNRAFTVIQLLVGDVC